MSKRLKGLATAGDLALYRQSGSPVQIVLRVIAFSAFLLLIGSTQLSGAAAGIPGKFYEYHLIATTGETPSGAPSALTGMGDNPSVNSNGTVGFVGQFSNGESVVAGDATGSGPTLISAGFIGSNRAFGRAVQVNDAGLIMANDRVTGNPPIYFERLWNTASPGSFTTVAKGGPSSLGPTYKWDAVFNQGSVNSAGDTAFGALLGTQTLLVSITAGGTTNQVPMPNNTLLRPMIADNGLIVVRYGNTVNSPIYLYSQDLSTFQVIASTANFSATGNQPGISRDGTVVTFYGVLTAVGAVALGTTPGPGIFAAIDEGGTSRHIVRILGRQIEDLSATISSNPNYNPANNKNGVCDGPWSSPPHAAEACKPAPELGYDNSGNPIYFATSLTSSPRDGFTPNANSRVGVADADFGAPGIDNNTFVISFEGTPSEASRDNPVVPGTPLLFSASQGLWTVRVDVEHVPIPPNGVISGQRTYHSYGVIPVVQLGDKVGGHTISGITVFDPIAAAAKDDSGTVRTQRRGDHRLAFWASATTGEQLIVRASHLDSDQDGLLDFWETSGIDMDQDGVIDLNLKAMGANPTKRDLFIETDWLADQPQFVFEPAPGVIAQRLASVSGPLVSMFAAAPALSGAMYGVTSDSSTPTDIVAGISLHVDAGAGNDSTGLVPFSYSMGTGPLQGGDQIGLPGLPNALIDVVYFGVPPITCGNAPCVIPSGIQTRSFQDIKDHFFGSGDKDARELAFHYIVLAMTQGFVLDSSNNPFVSGIAATPPATSNAITLTASAGPACSQASPPPLPSGALCGQVIKITTGTGSGQFSHIFAVSGNTLALQFSLTTVPDSTSQIVVLKGSSGLAELSEQNVLAPVPDLNSIPGNDSLITLGGFGRDPGGHLGNWCFEWRTIAHEFGHTLGLRHAGNDNTPNNLPNHFSLMSYAYQTACPRTGASIVQSYAGAADPVFNDWANLKHNFTDAETALGNSFLLGGLGSVLASLPDSPEVTPLDLLQANGPLDQTAPVVSLTSPAPGTTLTLGSSTLVTLTATDDSAVASVDLAFDLNGNGVTTDPGERVPANLQSGNTYSATFGPTSGPPGVRIISAFATDPSGNIGSNSATVTISTGAAQVAVPNVVGLTKAAATTAITGAGLMLGTVTTAASSTVPAGNVISESPTAGTMVSSGSAVNLVISTGAAQVAVPNVVGLTKAAATTAITGAGLVLGTVTTAASSTVPAGNVISESPTAGTMVSSGSAVNLVISTGAAVPLIIWANPADILYGSALGPTQLNAIANTPGTFVYTPSVGTVLSIGDGQTLQVSFTPTDVVHFVAASKTVVINVKPLARSGLANLVVTAQLSRDSVTNEVIVNLTVANSGGTTATAVQLNMVTIGATSSTTAFPISLGSIVASGQTGATIRVPAVVGTAGTRVVLSVAGGFAGSSFGGNIRVTLP